MKNSRLLNLVNRLAYKCNGSFEDLFRYKQQKRKNEAKKEMLRLTTLYGLAYNRLLKHKPDKTVLVVDKELSSGFAHTTKIVLV